MGENKKQESSTELSSDLKKEPKAGADDNVIYVGAKPLVNYIKGVITQFQRKGATEVLIKSRGKFISKAVDVAEVAKRSMADMHIQVKSISIASESFEIDGHKTNISTMEIVLGI